MKEIGFTFCRAYVDDKRWDKDRAEEYGYIRAYKNSIELARCLVYKKGMEVKIIDPKNTEIKSDYLFQGNFIKINPLPSGKPVPLCGPDIELHSGTKEGLAKLAKDLGLPDK